MRDPEHQSLSIGCVAAILPAAGQGRRFGSAANKLFATLHDQPIWWHAAKRLRDQAEIGRIVMPVSERDTALLKERFGDQLAQLQIELVIGGQQRTDSVRAALDRLANDEQIRFIAVHDAARPLVSTADVQAVIRVAAQSAGAILATPVTGTIKRTVDQGGSCQTVDRRDLWIALTPQVFRVDVLRDAYNRHRGRPATDDAELVERIGYRVAIVPGSADNLKITHPEDLGLARAILERQNEHA